MTCRNRSGRFSSYRYIVLGLFLLFWVTPLAAQYVLLDENFDNLDNWNDLSLAVTWGGYSEPTSAFNMTNGAVTLTDDAKAHSGYASGSDLKTFTCLDYQFPYTIDHTSHSVTIDFRARWVGGTSSSEGSRFCVFFSYDYPAGGLNLDLDDKYDDFDTEWWARPAYNIRIRGLNTTALAMYGGGPNPMGEYEKYGASWWLPGFASAPGGGSPGTPSAKGWVQSSGSLYSTSWRDYRYVLTPTHQELWWDADGDGVITNNERAIQQDITSDPDNSAYFNFFAHIDGVRLFWRGQNGRTQAEITFLKIETDQDNPIAVDLTSFTAVALGSSVTLQWQTAAEINHAGFNIYKSRKELSGYQKINPNFIMAHGNGSGARYEYQDMAGGSDTSFYKLESVSLDGRRSLHPPVKVRRATHIASDGEASQNFTLYSNYPNPFNPATTITFELAEAQFSTLSVYDMRGHLVKTLVNQHCPAGRHQTVWDGTDLAGVSVASGLYIYKIVAGGKTETKRMLLLR